MWCLGLGAIPKMRSSVQGNGLKLGKFLNAKHSSPMHLDGRCPLPESIKMSTKEPYVYFPPLKVLGIGSRVLCVLEKHSALELHSWRCVSDQIQFT